MSIETRGSMENILNTFNAKDWSSPGKIDLETGTRISFDESKVAFEGEKSTTFGEILGKYIGEVNDLQQNANKSIEQLVTGKSQNIHETMLMVEKADLAFKTMNQIRIKIIEAYKEIMKMQV
jgi:flagellar hook-basal body complex protein FliE